MVYRLAYSHAHAHAHELSFIPFSHVTVMTTRTVGAASGLWFMVDCQACEVGCGTFHATLCSLLRLFLFRLA